MNKKNPFNTHAKLFRHMDSLSEFAQMGDTLAPIFLEVNPTNKCNLRCKWCFCDHRPKDNTSLQLAPFQRFCKEFSWKGGLGGKGKAITFAGGGEPTTHPKFRELLKTVTDNGMEVALISNGVFRKSYCRDIVESCEWVRISLDVSNSEAFFKMKGKNAADVALNNIREMYKIKQQTNSRCVIGVCANVSEYHTIELLNEMVNTCKGICDYIQFRPALPIAMFDEKYTSETKAHLLDLWDHLRTLVSQGESQIRLSDDKIADIESGNKRGKCYGHVLNPILDANGELRICMYHPGNPNFKMGNIYQQTLAEIWHSYLRKTNIQKLLTSDLDKLKCQICCKLEETNKLLNVIADCKNIAHGNFL